MSCPLKSRNAEVFCVSTVAGFVSGLLGIAFVPLATCGLFGYVYKTEPPETEISDL